MYGFKVYQIYGIKYFKKSLINHPWNVALLAMLLWSLFATLFADDKMLAFYGTSYRNDGFFTYCIYATIYCCTQVTSMKKRVRYF